MTIIQEIHAWSKKLPVWQQDAIARLYQNRILSADDFDDLYALAKAESGISDPSNRKPKKLEDAQIAPSVDPSRVVQLVAIKNLVNVNALAAGGGVPIAPKGLTVIYGENGTGKSGYSRVFKHACRARDQREPVLPNANLGPSTTAVAQAIFEVQINGVTTDIPWQYGVTAPEPLSDISIFDTHCARAYVDNHGDFAYAPYGLDILEGLAGACNKLKSFAMQEKSANAPSDVAYAALVQEQTAVAAMLLGIPAKTNYDHVEILATLNQTEQDRLILLTKTLAEADPKQKAQTLRQKATRFSGLKDRIAAAIALINDEKVKQLRELIGKSKAAKAAAALAADEFKNTLDQLAGTGGEEWKSLFEAARIFAKISYPDHEFPTVPEEAKCPLCQNRLGEDGVTRLAQFDTFIKQAVERSAKNAREIAAIAYKTVQSAPLDVMFRDGLVEELMEIDPGLAAKCSSMQEQLYTRKKLILQAAAAELQWEEVLALPTDPLPHLSSLTKRLQDQALALEATADEKVRAEMVTENRELSARRRLGEIKSAVLESIAKHEVCRKLQTCIDGFDTRAISRKSTELSKTTANQELADALNEELKSLKMHRLQVVMKPESSGGKTQFKLILQLPGGGTPTTILSEGEQRAIAIASFLAEVKLGKGRGGIVLDDPISSLDHRRRWEVANRLAIESLTRQVIIFTHDIYFLCILEQKAKEFDTLLTKNYIRRTAQGYGVHSPNLPFDVAGTKDRLAKLRQALVEVRQVQKDGDEDKHRRLTATCYGRLRLAWERCVEEVLLNGAVQRFGEGVSTQRLKSVVVTDNDYKMIDAGMTKCSKFEHDAAMPIGRLPIPEPEELEKDIDNLASWRTDLERRLKETARARS